MQAHRPAHGAFLDKTIALLRPQRDLIPKIEAALEESKGEPVWSHHQVAVPKKGFDLKALGFKPTRLSIPLPGEAWGTPSWRRGPLHAHEQGPVYLIHKDADEPGLMHLLHDVPGALKKRLLEKIEPFVKEKKAMNTVMAAACADELANIQKQAGLWQALNTPIAGTPSLGGVAENIGKAVRGVAGAGGGAHPDFANFQKAYRSAPPAAASSIKQRVMGSPPPMRGAMARA